MLQNYPTRKPSTGIAVPDVKEESSDAKYKASAPTSSGLPNRSGNKGKRILLSF